MCNGKRTSHAKHVYIGSGRNSVNDGLKILIILGFQSMLDIQDIILKGFCKKRI